MKYEFKDGTFYGEIKNGKREGYGEFVYHEGNFLSGTFKNDNVDGYGEYIFKDKTYYIGQFKNGIWDGIGVFKGLDFRYEGHFKNNYWDGFGILFNKGHTIVGYWSNTKLVGRAVYFYDNGEYEYCNFIDGNLISKEFGGYYSQESLNKHIENVRNEFIAFRSANDPNYIKKQQEKQVNQANLSTPQKSNPYQQSTQQQTTIKNQQTNQTQSPSQSQQTIQTQQSDQSNLINRMTQINEQKEKSKPVETQSNNSQSSPNKNNKTAIHQEIENYNKAVNLYNSKKYTDALNILKQIKTEDESFAQEVSDFIKCCKEKLAEILCEEAKSFASSELFEIALRKVNESKSLCQDPEHLEYCEKLIERIKIIEYCTSQFELAKKYVDDQNFSDAMYIYQRLCKKYKDIPEVYKLRLR